MRINLGSGKVHRVIDLANLVNELIGQTLGKFDQNASQQTLRKFDQKCCAKTFRKSLTNKLSPYRACRVNGAEPRYFRKSVDGKNASQKTCAKENTNQK